MAAICLAIGMSTAWAEDEEINARTFDLRVLSLSRDGWVVLFETSQEPIPAVGRLLLLRKDGKSAVAVRILKTYPREGRIAAKIVRRLDPQATIAPKESLLAIEKVSDVAAPASTAQDMLDIEEAEGLAEPEHLAAPSEEATAVRSSGAHISGLNIETDNIVVRPIRVKGAAMGLAEIRGTYGHPTRGLIFNGKTRVNVAPNGSFILRLPVQAVETSVVFSLDAVKESGQLESEDVKIRLPKWDAWLRSLQTAQAVPKNLLYKRWILTPALGVTYQTYEQPDGIALQQFALTPKVSMTYQLVPYRWDLAANAFITALPISSNYPSVKFRTFASNVRIGYILPTGTAGIREPWKVKLMLGAYYTTTFASPALFGYKNTAGPQFYPAVTRTLSGGRSWSAYLKYSPVSNGISFLTLSNAELAAGASYQGLKFQKLPLALTFDFAQLSLKISTGTVRSRTFTLGTSLEF